MEYKLTIQKTSNYDAENKVYKGHRIDKNGEVVPYDFRGIMAESMNVLETLDRYSATYAIALAVTLSNVTQKMVSDSGMTSMDKWLSANFKHIDVKTARKYRKIGFFFAESYTDEKGKKQYRWCEPIPQDVTISNLDRVLSLLKVKWDSYDTLSKEEVEKVRNDFINDYILTDKIHLLASQNALKEEIKALNDIVVTYTEKTEDKTEEKTEDKTEDKTEEKPEDKTEEKEDKTENAKNYINALSVIFSGNNVALKLLSDLAKHIGDIQ